MWPEEVNDFCGFPTVEGEVQRIVDLAKQLGGEGFEDLAEEEVEELIDCHVEQLTTEELDKLTKSWESEEEEEEDQPKKPQMTAKIISELLKIGEDLKQKAIQIDTDMERSIAF